MNTDASKYNLDTPKGVEAFASDIAAELIIHTRAPVQDMLSMSRVDYWNALLATLAGAMSADVGTGSASALLMHAADMTLKAGAAER